MAAQALPSLELLSQLLRYEPETGKLFWRERPVDLFASGKQSAEHNCKAWNAKLAGKEAFTSGTVHGYKCGRISRRTFYAHRVAWAIQTGRWPTGEIDHINGIGTDNRFANLREVTHTQNLRNQRIQARNKSGRIGVHWDKFFCKWKAYINGPNSRIELGSFDAFHDAVAARKYAEIQFGYHPNHGRKRRVS